MTTLIFNLAGGIGLFLLGMHLMTEGLKASAGSALRNILAASTRTRLRGVFSGIFITSLVQSSSAVTVATIGFVNAGLLTLTEAVAITYGSNIGTTMTGWLVAAIGFHLNIKAFALPAIGIGMFLKLLSKNHRLAAAGEAIAGFGVFFLGIDLLKEGFSGLEQNFSLSAIGEVGILNLLFFVGLGFLLTVLTQSSSAAIAITLTATGSGLLNLEAAAAMVIGANVGTTSTALIAVIGATPNAKRMALAHILFNILTGAVALSILPLLLSGLHLLQANVLMDSSDVAFLALFHTTFNILGVLLMWPLTNRLVRWLSTCFRLAEEDAAKPQHLDHTLISTPGLALEALSLELIRIGKITASMCKGVLSSEATTDLRLERELTVIDHLVDAVGDFTTNLRQGNLPENLAAVLPQAIGIARYYRDNAELAIHINQHPLHTMPEALLEEMTDFKHEVVTLIDDAIEHSPNFDHAVSKQRRDSLDKEYQQLKHRILHTGTTGKLPVRQVVELVEVSKDIERMAKQMAKAAEGLRQLQNASEEKTDGAADEIDTPASTT